MDSFLHSNGTLGCRPFRSNSLAVGPLWVSRIFFKPTEELFAELLRTFFTQLSQAPSDLFGDDLTKGNFLGSCALSLLEICNTDAPKLQKRCTKLRELVEEKFGLSTEDLALLGEDAPEVVDLQGQDFILREDMGAMD